MSVIINNKTYISGVSNVEDDFIEISPNCEELDLIGYSNTYYQVDEFIYQSTYIQNGDEYTANITEDLYGFLANETYQVEVTNVIRYDAENNPININPYIAITQDNSYWIENDVYDFNSIGANGKVYINDTFLGTSYPLLLEATIKIYKLTQTKIEYEDCDNISQKIIVAREKIQRELIFKDGPNGEIVSPSPSYSDLDTGNLIAPLPFFCNNSKIYTYLENINENYNNGFKFFYTTGANQRIELKIENIDGYCQFDLLDSNLNTIGTYTTTNGSQNEFETFILSILPAQYNSYLYINPTLSGLNCDPITITSGKMTLLLTDNGNDLNCCACNSNLDLCASDTVELKFYQNCGDIEKIKIKGKLQGGTYKITGDEFTTYSGERIRPTTNIEAQYNLVIFEYSDAFFLAIQDLIANNLTIKIGAYEYYFFTNDIVPTWDNFSEYGFATIPLVRKDTIKKIRRNCCS